MGGIMRIVNVEGLLGSNQDGLFSERASITRTKYALRCLSQADGA